jgi:hypothetical protein
VALIYRTILVLMVAGIVWFSMHKHAEERDRSVRVQNLRECFERREFAAQAAPQRVRTHFFTALVRLDEALKAERVLGWLRHQEISVDWYVNQALEGSAGSSEEASMIGTALQNAYHEVRRHDILALPAERDRLLSGSEPTATAGLFAGDPLVFGYRVSPVIVPELRNHPANFILQPQTAWAMQQDIVDSSTVSIVRQFHTAGILSKPVFDRFLADYGPRQNQAVTTKND